MPSVVGAKRRFACYSLSCLCSCEGYTANGYIVQIAPGWAKVGKDRVACPQHAFQRAVQLHRQRHAQHD